MIAEIAGDVLTKCNASARGCPGAFGIDDFGVSEMWKAIIRIDNIVFLAATLLLFGWQTYKMWGELGKRRQYLCLGLGMFMFAGIEGSIEQLLGWTFGPRVLITWLSCIFVLYAVVLRDAGRDKPVMTESDSQQFREWKRREDARRAMEQEHSDG